jgi:hypothetical protein
VSEKCALGLDIRIRAEQIELLVQGKGQLDTLFLVNLNSVEVVNDNHGQPHMPPNILRLKNNLAGVAVGGKP